MKTLTTFCLLAVLLCAALILAQDFSEDGRPTKCTPFLRPSLESLQGRERHCFLERERLPGRDYLLRSIDPVDLFEEWIEKVRGIPYQERIRCFMGRGAHLHSGYSAQSSLSTEVGEAQSLSGGVQEAWVSHYASGLAPSSDVATAVAVDGSGNVYVTGRSTNPPLGTDYFTAKYDASGTQVWTARYNGVGNGDDFPCAIAVDGSGNVYVTGWSRGSDTWKDYVTIKYNSSGVQQWVARYNGPGNGRDGATALAVDASGNVFVTGVINWGSGTGSDYATVKYDSDGVQQWVARYNGPGNSFNLDRATALAVDGSGNVYVTGESWGSGTEGDYATVKYNSSGVQQWIARYNNRWQYNGRLVNADDRASALAVDALGNVYVTGWSYGSRTDYDYATVKYNSSGVQQWVARYNGLENDWDWATALAVDALGNVYVTGWSWGISTGSDYATVKYNPVGIEQWVVRYNGPGNSHDGARALAVDGSGNVYVTGSSVGPGTDYDYATVKYNSAGVQQWVARYNGPGNSHDGATALAVDASGNVYVTGYSASSSTYPHNEDYATVKYDSAGVQQWVARYNGPGNDDDGASALALDASGNVYVAGSSEGIGWSIYTTIKYVQTPTSVKEIEPGRPKAYYLSQNYPNPFNPSTMIRFALAKPGYVRLKVFNLLGQEVATLVSEKKQAGEYEVQWNPDNLSSGVYIYRLQTGEFVKTKKLILLK